MIWGRGSHFANVKKPSNPKIVILQNWGNQQYWRTDMVVYWCGVGIPILQMAKAIQPQRLRIYSRRFQPLKHIFPHLVPNDAYVIIMNHTFCLYIYINNHIHTHTYAIICILNIVLHKHWRVDTVCMQIHIYIYIYTLSDGKRDDGKKHVPASIGARMVEKEWSA